MRAVAVGAIARCARMLHFGLLDQLGLVVVAGHAERLDVGLRQHHFAVFCRSVADVALLAAKGGCMNLAISLGAC